MFSQSKPTSGFAMSYFFYFVVISLPHRGQRCATQRTEAGQFDINLCLTFSSTRWTTIIRKEFRFKRSNSRTCVY